MKGIENGDVSSKKEDSDSDSDDADIEAQIRRELEGLQPSKKKLRPVQATQLEMPCGTSLYIHGHAMNCGFFKIAVDTDYRQ